MRATKALACLRISAGSPELPLYDNAKSTVLTSNLMCSLNIVMCTRVTAPAGGVRTSGTLTLSLLAATFVMCYVSFANSLNLDINFNSSSDLDPNHLTL